MYLSSAAFKPWCCNAFKAQPVSCYFAETTFSYALLSQTEEILSGPQKPRMVKRTVFKGQALNLYYCCGMSEMQQALLLMQSSLFFFFIFQNEFCFNIMRTVFHMSICQLQSPATASLQSRSLNFMLLVLCYIPDKVSRFIKWAPPYLSSQLCHK